jgi:hypothetical protein
MHIIERFPESGFAVRQLTIVLSLFGENIPTTVRMVEGRQPVLLARLERVARSGGDYCEREWIAGVNPGRSEANFLGFLFWILIWVLIWGSYEEKSKVKIPTLKSQRARF